MRIDDTKLEAVRNWVDTNFDLFYANIRGDNRWIYQIPNYETFKYPEEFLDIKYELMDMFGVPVYAGQDRDIYDAIGVQIKGGFTHSHLDNNDGDNIHFRLNVLASKSIGGGMPIIADEIIEVEEGEPWICYSGIEWHSTTEVKGDKRRILLTYGFTLPKDDKFFDAVWNDYRKEMFLV
jgi:hypothetical protein